MMVFARTDTSVLGRWWWTVDRWTLAALVCLMAFGALLILAVSPTAASRLGGLDSFQLAQRQMLFLSMGLVTVIGVSLLEPRTLRRLAVIGLAASIPLLGLTLLAGHEIKGATRWLSVGGLSFQVSEFVKPFLAVVMAWLLAAEQAKEGIPGTKIALVLWFMIAALFLLQPDVGQTFMITAVSCRLKRMLMSVSTAILPNDLPTPSMTRWSSCWSQSGGCGLPFFNRGSPPFASGSLCCRPLLRRRTDRRAPA